jgi:hypothetical protein
MRGQVRPVKSSTVSTTLNSLRANKIYRTLKLLYRDLKKLPEVKTEPLKDKLIEEAFALCADHGALHISQRDNFTNMFGYELDEDELRVFAK